MKTVVVLLILAAISAVVLPFGLGLYAAAARISEGALSGAITLGLALGLCGGLGIPGLLAVLVLTRSRRQVDDATAFPVERYTDPELSYTRPQVMVIPPMALPTTRQQQASWAQAPGPRQYKIIGEEDGG